MKDETILKLINSDILGDKELGVSYLGTRDWEEVVEFFTQYGEEHPYNDDGNFIHRNQVGRTDIYYKEDSFKLSFPGDRCIINHFGRIFLVVDSSLPTFRQI